jgi:hypothetical protein
MAKKHEALYRRFKADESAQTITGPYRQLHPHDNNERQAVHEHESGLTTASPPARDEQVRPRAGSVAKASTASAGAPAGGGR